MAALFRRSFFSLWLSKDPKFKFLLTVLLAILGSYVAYKWYFYPHIDNIKRIKMKENKIRQAIAVAEKERWDDIQGMKNRIAGLDKSLARLRQVVPDYQDLPGVMVYISGLAEKCGVKPVVEKNRRAGIRIEKLVSHKGYSSYDLVLHIHGSPSQVYAFISQLEEMPRLVQIESLRLEVLSWENVQCSLTLRVFILGRPQKDPQFRSFMQFVEVKSWPYEMLKPSLSDELNVQSQAVPSGSSDVYEEDRVEDRFVHATEEPGSPNAK